MSDNDKNLKAMWNNAENIMGSSDYESSTIEKFISKRSNSTAQKVKNMIFLDLALKSLILLILGIDIFLFFGTSNVIAVCVTALFCWCR